MGIIEQRVADRGSWHWEQTDVAILKKYTTSEINMKSVGSKIWRMVITLSTCFLANHKGLLRGQAPPIGKSMS